MTAWPRVPIGELLERSGETAMLDPERQYHEVTIKLWGKGVVSRGKVRGSEVTAPRRFVRTGQFILSKIDARNGAMGLVPPELDGAIVSNDFPSFRIRNKAPLDPKFLGWLARSAWFVELCKSASEGTTNRVRIKEDRFLGCEIPLPTLPKQKAIAANLDAIEDKARQVEGHLVAVEMVADHLLALRFQDAIVGARYHPMSNVAPLVRREIEIDTESRYTELGVRSFFKGTFHRRTVMGREFTWQKLFLVRQNDLVFSNIMAWEKAVAIATAHDDLCVGNHRMLTCSAAADIADPAFLHYYFTTDDGFSKIYAASPGTSARNRTMTASALEAITVPVPPLATQKAFGTLLARVQDLKALHAGMRRSNAALVPATLERLFTS